jgi:DNA modification methylase
LISIYSQEDDLILDPFAGTGSTLVASKRLRRFGIGVELSDEFIEVYENRGDNANLFDNDEYAPVLVKGDARNLSDWVQKESVQLTVTSPPYWDILNQKRTADYRDAKNYSDSDADLGNIQSYGMFLSALKGVFGKVYDATANCGVCCVVVMDIRKKNKFYPLHIDTIGFMADVGFVLDDIIIWDRRQEYNNLRPLGYPHVFRVNKVHEFILVFKK